MRVLVFGDSITQGFWDTQGGWVERISRNFNAIAMQDLEAPHATVFNLGILGDTVPGLSARIEGESTARSLWGHQITHVIAIGVNDTCLENGKPVSSPEKFRADLGQLADKVEVAADQQLWIGMTYVDDSHPFVSGEYTYRAALVWEFEQVLRDFCRERNLPLVPVFEEFAARHWQESLLIDGVHPNDPGHQFLAELIEQKLTELLNWPPAKEANAREIRPHSKSVHNGIFSSDEPAHEPSLVDSSSTSDESQSMQIMVIGDSITQGFWDGQGGWVARIQRRYIDIALKNLDGGFPAVFNLGISGDATKDVLARIEAESKARMWTTKTVQVLATGINDSRIENGKPQSSPEKFRAELEKLADKVQKIADLQLWVGLTPVADDCAFFQSERVWEFEQVLRDVCQERNLPFVPVFEEFAARHQEENLFIDGVHPNDAGHQLLAKLIEPRLSELINWPLSKTSKAVLTTTSSS